MNQNYDDQQKKRADQNSGQMQDDLQTEKTQQSTSKIDDEYTKE